MGRLRHSGSFGSRLLHPSKRKPRLPGGSSRTPVLRRTASELRPSADWDWDWVWVWDWVTPGSPKRDPRVTQASRLGHPWVELNKWFCLQQKLEKAGWGRIGVIAKEKPLPRINTDDRGSGTRRGEVLLHPLSRSAWL